MSQCLIDPSSGSITLRMDGFAARPDMFAGVVPVENPLRICEVFLVNRPAPLASIGSEDFLLSFAITTATCQSIQRSAERLKIVVLPPDDTLVPALVVILPVD